MTDEIKDEVIVALRKRITELEREKVSAERRAQEAEARVRVLKVALTIAAKRFENCDWDDNVKCRPFRRYCEDARAVLSWQAEPQECPECHGRGSKDEYDERDCDACGGTGLLQAEPQEEPPPVLYGTNGA